VNLAIVRDLIKEHNVDKRFDPIVEYIAAISGDLIDERNTDMNVWIEAIRHSY
ncbi:hypothetical protein FF38_13420, partial [Lucilia cuprina]